MKQLITFCCFVSILFFQNVQAQDGFPCGVQNPLEELEWLGDIADMLCDFENCLGEIHQVVYNGQTYFYVTPHPFCSDIPTNVYDCDGELLCFFGGFIGGTGVDCPDFWETIEDDTVIASNASCCLSGSVTVTMPTNSICTTGFIPPPILTVGIGLSVPPAGDGLDIFMVDNDGNIVLPFTSEMEIDFSGVTGGWYCVMAINYNTADPYDNTVTTLSELLTDDACFNLSDCTPMSNIFVWNQIPFVAITTPPMCNPDGTYDVGMTVTGSSGSAYINNYGVVAQEGVEIFVTFDEPFYEAYAIDVLSGCADDAIELFGPVECDACIDEDLITTDPCNMIYAPVCGCNGLTYHNECVAMNFHGVSEVTEGECACYDSDLVDEDCICPEIYDPVCGCDGVVYDNDCFAQCEGITTWRSGMCTVNSIIVCAGEGVQLGGDPQPNTFYTWTPAEGLSCTDCPDPMASPTETTLYRLATSTTVDLFSPPAWIFYEVVVDICDGVEPIEQAIVLNLFPNPVKDIVRIETENTLIQKVIVFDVLGRTMVEMNGVMREEVTINMNAWQSGLYIVRIATEKGIVVREIVR